MSLIPDYYNTILDPRSKLRYFEKINDIGFDPYELNRWVKLEACDKKYAYWQIRKLYMCIWNINFNFCKLDP